MPTPRHYMGVVAYNSEIYVIGGFNGRPLDDIEIFDIEKNEWIVREDAPVSMSAHSCVENHGSIYIFGDYKELNRVLIYNIETDKWLNIESNFKSRRHNTVEPDMAVGRAVALDYLSKDEIPEEVFSYISNSVDFYRSNYM